MLSYPDGRLGSALLIRRIHAVSQHLAFEHNNQTDLAPLSAKLEFANAIFEYLVLFHPYRTAATR